MPFKWSNIRFGQDPEEEQNLGDFSAPRFSFGRQMPFNLGTNQQNSINTVAPQRPVRTSAYDRYMQLADEQPIYGDQKYERGKWGKLGSILAGAAVGGLTGDMNAGVRTSQNFLNQPFERAYSQWEQRFKGAQSAAKEEREREDQFRKGRLDESNIARNYAAAESDLEMIPYNKADKESLISSRAAQANLDEARTLQIKNDIDNPDLMSDTDNRGNLTFYNKQTGEAVRQYKGVGFSEDELIRLRGRIESGHIRDRGKVEAGLIPLRGAEARKTVGEQQAGLERLSDRGFRNNLMIEAFQEAGRMNRQEDAQKDRNERAESSGQARGNLTNPQFNREFDNALIELGEDPQNKQLIDEYFTRDSMGRRIMTDPENPESLELYNKVITYMRSKGKK